MTDIRIIVPSAAPTTSDPESLLSLANENVAEEDGTMTFQVVRAVDGQGLIAYDFKTVEGTAKPTDFDVDRDYEVLQGSTWIASGETNDHVITITNDAVSESSEIFTFEIFNIRFLE